MKAFLLILLAVLTPHALAQVTLQPNMTWHVQLQGELPKIDRQLFDIDLFDTPNATITDLKSQGRVVICYFSAGSYEDWRPDAKQFPQAVLGSDLSGWPGERWLDISSAQLRPVMTARLDLAKQKGCDGVDPDNVDGYSNKTGFPLTAAQQIDYNRWLAEQAHARGLVIGLKNSVELVDDLVTNFDFAINESCFDWNECALLKPFPQQGRPVFAIDYGGYNQQRCDQAKELGLNLQFYDKALKGVGKPCTGGGSGSGTTGSGSSADDE